MIDIETVVIVTAVIDKIFSVPPQGDRKKGGLAMKKDATLGQAAKILSLFEETPVDQVQALLASGLLADLRDANIARIERNSFRKHIGLKPFSPLLKYLGTITLPATTEKFVVREKFVVNSEKTPVKISFLGDNFKEWFLNKIEEPKPETKIRYAKLLKYSVDGPILSDLGNAVEITLADIYGLMLNQPNGEYGTFLNNGMANIFYVRDVKGALRAVSVYWYGVGWYVIAYSVAYPLGWDDGYCVFSAIPEAPGI